MGNLLAMKWTLDELRKTTDEFEPRDAILRLLENSDIVV